MLLDSICDVILLHGCIFQRLNLMNKALFPVVLSILLLFVLFELWSGSVLPVLLMLYLLPW